MTKANEFARWFSARRAVWAAFLVTALVAAPLGWLGLLAVPDFRADTLRPVFFLAYVPAVAAGLLVAWRKA